MIIAGVSQKVDIGVLPQYMLKKISLVIVDEASVHHTHLRYIEYMIVQIKMLAKAKRVIDLRDLVMHLYKARDSFQRQSLN